MANNIAREYIDFSKKNITKYLKIILDKYYAKKIVDPLLEVYINVRYYNNEDIKYKNFTSNINYYLRQKAIEMKENEDEDTIFKIKNTFYLFKYILYFDNVEEYESLKKVILEIDEYRNEELGLNDETFIDTLYELVKENESRKDKYLKSFDSEKFSISLIKTNNKKVYQVKLDNTIKFNRIYSEYSINKVYSEGIVNEQKSFITYYLTSKIILENAIKDYNNMFGTSYDTSSETNLIVDFPISIFDKEQKLNRLINIIDNEIVKNNIIIKFKYSDYLVNKDQINTWIKDGFQVAVEIDEGYNYDDSSKLWLDIFIYVIVDTNKQNFFDEEKVIIE